MKLRYAPFSPFARKVRIAANLLGLENDIALVEADTMDANDTLRQQNPLGKLPVLLLDDGTTLYDSRVIVDYLDHRAGGGRIIPREEKPRYAALTMQALGDGIMEAALLIVYEGRWRPQEHHVERWVTHQQDKIARALAGLEAAPPQRAARADIGQIAIACALGYLDIRLAGRWRTNHPQLVQWLDDFAERVPAFAATAPPQA